MTLNWKDTKSYRGHLEDMREFCRLHEKQNVIEAPCPQHQEPRLTDKAAAGTTNIYTDGNGRIIVVPIWRTVPAKGSQN